MYGTRAPLKGSGVLSSSRHHGRDSRPDDAEVWPIGQVVSGHFRRRHIDVMAWLSPAGARRDASRGSHRDATHPARSAPTRIAFVPVWTGRAVTSRATESGLPHLITAGTHRTRVSEMRVIAAPGGRRSVNGASARPAAGAPAIAERRDLARRLPDHRGSRG